MTPIEIIAYQIPGSSAELCFGIADATIEALTAAGIHLMTDADLAARDDAVLERAAVAACTCAVVVPLSAGLPDGASMAAAQIASAIRSLKGGRS